MTQTDSTPATFDALALSAEVRKAIDEIGFTTPTPVQLAAYAPAIAGRDLVVQARTGTGKTAAFGLPLVDKLVRPEAVTQALILAPTRELALQSAREIERLGKYRGLRTTAVYGGAPMERQVQELAGGAQIVSGTPGRVLDHIKRGTLDPSTLRVLVLDEADEMLSMGFAKELHAILERLPATRQTLFFSATLADDVKRMTERHTRDAEFISLSSDAVGAATISHFIYTVSGLDRPRDLIRILEIEDPESAIIFCNTKAETERVAQELQQAGFDADWLNGDLPQSEREKVMSATRQGKLRYLVCTDVAARGIDISHLTHVINYALPESAEQYVHRTGRTGRAGRTGTAIALVGPREIGALYYLRLQYKIFPIERSLPSAGEERTRREVDRIHFLTEGFSGQASALDYATAKRLLTHDNAEAILAGLLASVFGTKGEDVDAQAAAARRAPRPAPVQPERSRHGARRERDRERSHEREVGEHGPEQAEQNAVAHEQPTQDAATARQERQERGPNDRPQRRSRHRRDEQITQTDAPRAQRERRPREDEAPQVIEQPPVANEATASDAADALEAENAGMAMLFLNVGRKDGARPGELSRLMRDVGLLEREEIGRIRVRDKHTFVGVTQDKADAVIERLVGTEFLGRTLAAERARR